MMDKVLFIILTLFIMAVIGNLWRNRGIEIGREQVAQECSTHNQFSVGSASYDCFEEE